jgi:fatty acyl-CoA reductase
LANNYMLTKRMCEGVVADMHRDGLPVAIVRPTVVGAIAQQPLPGYFGNAGGVTAATLAFASGDAPSQWDLRF